MYLISYSMIFLAVLSCCATGYAQEKGYIAPDGFRLNYTVQGTGMPALVIGSSEYYPRTFSENIHQHLKMIYLDHRGFVPPNGERTNADYELDKILDDMELARDQLKLGKIVVIGHSGHSFMALEYAKKYPQNVSRVVLIGTAPDFGPELSAWRNQVWNESADPDRKAAQQKWNEQITDNELASLSPARAFIRNYVRNGPHAWYDPHFDSTPLWDGVFVNTEMFAYVWGEVFANIDIRNGLDELDVPVFIALGRYDNLVAPPDSWNDYRENFRDLTIRVFEKSGHTPMLEEPEVFDLELLSWLNAK